jgi:predicted phage replisome organizer
MPKRYYWLKMHKDFFKTKDVKKLRRISGGDTFTIIYLKMMLLSLDTHGVITYEGIEDTFAEELALELDEEAVNVNATLLFLQNMGLISEENDEHTLNHVEQMIGSETPQAGYNRKRRIAKNQQVTTENVTLLPPVTKALQQSKRIELENRVREEIKDIDIYTHVFDFWISNAPTLPTPRKLTDKIKSAINGITNDGLTLDDIKHSIVAYNHILNGDQYFFDYRWGILDFLKKEGGCRRFADVTDDKQYLKNSSSKSIIISEECPY